MSRRWGLTVPLDGIPLAEHERVYREAEDLGFTDFWSYETIPILQLMNLQTNPEARAAESLAMLRALAPPS